MKLFTIAFVLLSITIAQANDDRKYQNFYRADDGGFLVEGGFEFLKLDGEYSKSIQDATGLDDVENSFTNKNLSFEYGLMKNLALGVELNYQRGPEYEGMQDHELFAKGQYNSFFYEFRYYYSFEDQTDDNAVSGGSHYMVELGYVYKGFGAKLNITPTYEYDFKDDSTKYESFTDTGLQIFYEHILNQNIYGVALSRSVTGKNEEDGVEISESSTYVGADFYAAIPVGPVTLLPAFRYLSLSSDNDNFDSLTISNLELKARYEF